MKILSAIWCLLFFASGAAAQQVPGADYVLSIDGVEHELALGQSVKIKLKTGQDVPVVLRKREFGRFSAGNLAFEYPGAYTVASTPVDVGITQHIVVTGLGTMMMVQHYESDIPSTLLDLLFDKMVEEPKALGLKIERTNLSRSISNNQVLEGVRATYKGGDDDVTVDITTTQTDQGGYMVMTMHDAYTSPEEKQIIERFWQSLSLKKPTTP